MAASPVIGSVRGPYPDVTFNGSSSPVSAAASPTTSEHFGVINSHGAGGGLSQVGAGGGGVPLGLPPPTTPETSPKKSWKTNGFSSAVQGKEPVRFGGS